MVPTMDVITLVSFVKNFNSKKTEEGRKKDEEVLRKIEPMFSNNWDVVKEEKIFLKSFVGDILTGMKEIADEFHTEINEKTIELGADHDNAELVVESFSFKIEHSVIKVNCVSLYPEFDPNDENTRGFVPKNKKLDINMDNVVEHVSDAKKDAWWFSINEYLTYRPTEKNGKRVQEKLNRIQGPTFNSLIDGTWTPDQEETEPDFFVTVNNLVAFGDFCDANKKTESKMTPDPGSTISFNINTVRKFHPGVYRLSVVTVKEDGSRSLPFVVFHHEKVSPRKVAANLLLTADLGLYKRAVTNSLNRYDWCQAMHWGPPGEKLPSTKDHDHEGGHLGFCSGSEDEDLSLDDDRGCKMKAADEEASSNLIPTKSLFRASKMGIIYFTPITESNSFEIGVKKGLHKESMKIKGAHQVYGSTTILKNDKDHSGHSEKNKKIPKILCDSNLDESKKVSIGMNMMSVLPCFEWLYGAVFQDEDTHLNFALAVFPDVRDFKHFQVGIPEAFKKHTFTKEDKKFIFKMEDFFYVS